MLRGGRGIREGDRLLDDSAVLPTRPPPTVLAWVCRAICCYRYPMSDGPHLHRIASHIWGTADDVLRDVYVRGKYCL